MKTLLHIAAAAILLTSGAAFAADSTSAPAKPAPQAAARSSEKVKVQKHASVRSEQSKKCSADADAKNLHGKERKAFRKACLKTA